MSSRRQIRAATVQVLYAAGSGGLLPDSIKDPALDLLLEPLRAKATRARAKALLHLQQGRHQAAAPLADFLRRLPLLPTPENEDDLAAAIRALHTAENHLEKTFGRIRRELKADGPPPRLEALLDACRSTNARSRTAAARIRTAQPTFPALESLRLEALDVCERLATLADRLQDSLAPHPGQRPEFRGVTASESETTTLAREVRASLERIATHLPAIDQHIESTVENYAPDRIDQVDRAILRLATCELLFDPHIPPGVAINEAVELARSFGTGNSPRFVNGVLDRIRQQSIPPQSVPGPPGG